MKFDNFLKNKICLSTFEYEIQDSKIIISGDSSINSTINSIINSNNIKSVEIQDGITGIDDNTFVDCSTIEEISFSTTLTEIGSNSFVNCQNIKEIILPDSLESIGESSFCNLGITSLNIPSKVTQIGLRVFQKNSNLTQLTVAEDNENYTSINNILYSKDMKTLIVSAEMNSETITIPENVEIICDYAFFIHSITSVSLPNTLKEIGFGAFQETGLTSIELKNVESIGMYAFYGCKKIQSIIFSQNYKEILNYTFTYNDVMKSLIIPGTVKTINAYAFAEYNALVDLTFNEGTEEIGESAFYSCDSITKIQLPTTIKSVGTAAFSDLSNLADVSLPSSLEFINEYLFFQCYNLKTINLNNVKRIGANAFGRCNNLIVLLFDKVELIGREAFSFCSSIQNISLPKTLTTIQPFAFYGTKSLKCIQIDQNNTNFVVIDNVLYTADQQELVIFPASNNISEFSTPGSVEILRGGSFSFLQFLNVLTISSKVETIENSTFTFSTSLKTINYCGSKVFTGSYFFETYNLTISVPNLDSIPKFGDLQTTQVDGICMIDESNNSKKVLIIVLTSITVAVVITLIIVVVLVIIRKKKKAAIATSTNEKPLI